MVEEETGQDETVEEIIPASEETLPKKPNKVEEAMKVADRLEKANAVQKELLDRAEELHAQNIISGISEGGKPAEAPEEESAEDYAKKVMAGDI